MLGSVSATETDDIANLTEDNVIGAVDDINANHEDSIENSNSIKDNANVEILGASNENEVLGSEIEFTGTTVSELISRISSASDGDTIFLNNDLTASGSGSYISSEVTLDGRGHTIDANGIKNIFQFNRNENFVFKNINFIKGPNSNDDGIIYMWYQAPSFINCTFNYTGPLRYGYGANSRIINCTFVNNRGSYGACIYAGNNQFTNIQISGCTFINNTATSGSPCVYFSTSVGDAHPLNMAIDNCTFENNTGEYGAINRMYGDLTNCNFINNAGHYSVVESWSGNIINCNFTRNTVTESAYNLASGILSMGENGGSDTIATTAKNCNFINNTVRASVLHTLTGIATVINCTCTDNTASYDFGSYAATSYVYNSTFNSTDVTNSMSNYATNILYLENNIAKKHILNNGRITSEVNIIVLENKTWYKNKNVMVNINGTIKDDNNNTIIVGSVRIGFNGADKYTFKILDQSGKQVSSVIINQQNVNTYYDRTTGIFKWGYTFTQDGTYPVTAEYSPATIFPNAQIKNGTIIIGNVPVSNMSVTKVANTSELNVGEKVKFTVNITNTGNQNLSNIVINEIFPDSWEFEICNGGWLYINNVLTHTGSLAPGKSWVFNITYKVKDNGTFNNTVVVKSSTTSNVTASSGNITVYRPNMTVVKTLNTTELNVGENIKFTVNITNTGDRNLTNIRVSEIFPSAIEYVSVSSGWTYNSATKILTYNGGKLTPGSSLVFNITFKAKSNGTYNNTVVVRTNVSSSVTNNSANFTIYSPNMTIVKTANVTELNVGEKVKFTVNITNTGNRNLTNINVTEVFPSAFEYVGFEGEGWSYNNKVLTYNGNLTPGKSLVFNITFKANINGTFNNTVVLRTKGNSPVTNSSVNITVYKPNMTVVKTANVTELNVGENIRFTVNITNTGDRNLTGINVSEVFPSALEYVGVSSGWSYNATSKVLTYTGGKLTPGSSLVFNITFKAKVNGTFNNTVVVRTNVSSSVTNHSANFTIYSPNMTVVKTVNVTDVTVGNLVKYTITINNTGDSNLSDIKVYETKLDGFVLTKYNSEDGWDNSTGIFKYNGVLNPNKVINLILVFNVTKQGTFVNNVNVSSNRTGNVSAFAPSLNVGGVNGSYVEGKDVVVYYGDDIVVPVTSINATGVYWEVIDKDGNIVASGTISPNSNITGLVLPVGNYTVELTTIVDNYHVSFTNTCNITVKIAPSYIIPVGEDIYVGDKETITVRLPGDATGNVTIVVNGKSYTAAVKDGKAVFTITGLKAGSYMISASYTGDDKYLSATGSGVFKVLKYTPDVDVDSPDITVGDDGKITVKLPSDATGTVTIKINGKSYTAPVRNGKAVFNIPNLKVGVHDFTVYYSGDDKYSSSKTSASINVLPLNDTIKENNTVKNEILKGNPKHVAGNPIMALLLVLTTIGFTRLRRLK